VLAAPWWWSPVACGGSTAACVALKPARWPCLQPARTATSGTTPPRSAHVGGLCSSKAKQIRSCIPHQCAAGVWCRNVAAFNPCHARRAFPMPAACARGWYKDGEICKQCIGGATSEGGPNAVCTCVDRGFAYVNSTSYDVSKGCACATGYAKMNGDSGGECSGERGGCLGGRAWPQRRQCARFEKCARACADSWEHLGHTIMCPLCSLRHQLLQQGRQVLGLPGRGLLGRPDRHHLLLRQRRHHLQHQQHLRLHPWLCLRRWP
jgi:hypothetical protein